MRLFLCFFLFTYSAALLGYGLLKLPALISGGWFIVLGAWRLY